MVSGDCFPDHPSDGIGAYLGAAWGLLQGSTSGVYLPAGRHPTPPASPPLPATTRCTNTRHTQPSPNCSTIRPLPSRGVFLIDCGALAAATLLVLALVEQFGDQIGQRGGRLLAVAVDLRRF